MILKLWYHKNYDIINDIYDIAYDIIYKNALQERSAPPDGLLQRRLNKERTEKEQAIKEKEIMQKKMDEMQAQLDLSHSKVGEVVSVESPITPSACKVRLKLV